MFAIIATEDMIKEGIASVKQLKNRYNDPNYYKRFVVGVERNKMKVYNLETEHMKRHMALADAGDSTPVFDKGSIGERIKAETTSSFKFDE
jgi:hypothetical protein